MIGEREEMIDQLIFVILYWSHQAYTRYAFQFFNVKYRITFYIS